MRDSVAAAQVLSRPAWLIQVFRTSPMDAFNEIVKYCHSTPDNPALSVYTKASGLVRSVSYRELLVGISHVGSALARFDQGREGLKYGVIMNNSPEWVVCDLALGLTGRIEVPVPTMFSAEQAKNLLKDVDVCLVDQKGFVLLDKWQAAWGHSRRIPTILISEVTLYPAKEVDCVSLDRYRLNERTHVHDICKIVHTSGTTSAPKGVMISKAALGEQVASLRSRIGQRTFERYLSIIPLSLLIEQITAIYLFMSYGGQLIFLDSNTPLLGSSGSHPRHYLDYFRITSPEFVVVSPSIVGAFYAYAKTNEDLGNAALSEGLFGMSSPPFIACGNAPIAPDILQYMHERGVPIMEGYGLSENTSVVTWNSPSCYRYGTVGKPIDHVRLKLNHKSELLVKSRSMFLGYSTEDPSSCRIDDDGWLHTGDIAEIDEDGFLKIKGRIKHIAITADGRNISPEWVESQYKRLEFVRSVVVFGEGLQKLSGVIVVEKLDGNETALREAIDAFGREHCSEIERIYDYMVVEGEKGLYDEYFTLTGDPKRAKIWDLFKTRQTVIAARAT